MKIREKIYTMRLRAVIHSQGLQDAKPKLISRTPRHLSEASTLVSNAFRNQFGKTLGRGRVILRRHLVILGLH
jgi:hypothetical protein